MSRRLATKHTYDEISNYDPGHNVELSFLPPMVATRPRKSPDEDTVTLLREADTAYTASRPNNRQLDDRIHTFLQDLRPDKSGKYLRLTSTPGDSTELKSPFRGWRKAVILAAATTAFVLLVNANFAIVATLKYPVEDGIGTLYTGDCGLVKRWDVAVHSIINLLGTALLAASSFTMQCLSSPTRSDIDGAHSRHKSLDIGLPSVKNLFYTKPWKGVLWLLLCISTLPLHLLWNSAIFSTSGTFLFTYVVAEESFLSGSAYQKVNGSWSNCHGLTLPTSRRFEPTLAAIYEGYQAGNYTRLSTADCFNTYNTQYIDDRRNLIMITTANTTTKMGKCAFPGQTWNGSSIIEVDVDLPTGWSGTIYNSTTSKNVQQTLQSSGTWTLRSWPIEYCYSETALTPECQLQYVSLFLYIVVGCNLVKFVCMCITARHLWNLDEPILATVGDAIASFLQKPDETTREICLLDLASLRGGSWRRGTVQSLYQRKSRVRLYSATTSTRWVWTMLLCTLYLITGYVLFALSFQLSGDSVTEGLKAKFGGVDADMIMGLDGSSVLGLTIDVLVANSFQLALSTTYFLYNSLYTAQCAALEWASYAQGKLKPLRVTWPRGMQRSTYYLQLPYRYGVPLTTLLILMHFLISQSIFLARLLYYDSLGNLTDHGFTDVGFSPSATLTTCCVGAAMIIAQVIHACRPLDNRIPIHGNNSAVMSAMCHIDQSGPSSKDSLNTQQRTDISQQPLMWGVTKKPASDQGSDPTSSIEATKSSAGHCSFTADVVELPEVGMRYQ